MWSLKEKDNICYGLLQSFASQLQYEKLEMGFFVIPNR